MMIEQHDLSYMEVAGFIGQIDDLAPVKPGESQPCDSWIAIEGDDVIGIALIEERTNRENHLHRIGVLPERQGEGIGRQLMERLTEEYGSFELEVDSEKPADDFYRHLGLELVEERPASFERGEGILNVWFQD